MHKKRTVVIASDHAGYDLKEYLKAHISEVEWLDQGPHSSDRTDYPDYAEKVAELVSSHAPSLGVLVCGSGIGMCITANKFAGVRAAVVESETSARLSRAHNDANVLCLGARILEPKLAERILKAWLETDFEGGRHSERLKKIQVIESKSPRKV